MIIDINDKKIVGSYNELPPNFKIIDENEFARSMFFLYYPIKTEFRQVRKLSEYEFTSIQIYWFFDYSYIVIWSDFWGRKVRYGKGYLCKHNFEIIESRMCYSKSKCKNCGFILEVDSSD